VLDDAGVVAVESGDDEAQPFGQQAHAQSTSEKPTLGQTVGGGGLGRS
jgi:hypothetical protein